MYKDETAKGKEGCHMGMNETPNGDRVHIGLFGKRNAGKSSVMNALIGQQLSIVSDVMGTTTDPVHKTMELLPLGPVVFTDTPGLDDEGVLGKFRTEKTYQILEQTDIAIVVIDGLVGKAQEDIRLITYIQDKKIPYVVVYNKQDLLPEKEEAVEVSELLAKYRSGTEIGIWVSTENSYHILELKELLAGMKPELEAEVPILADLINPGEVVILVVPIDKAAPKGRLILPQQQTIRELLDVGAVPVVTRVTELEQTWKKLTEPPAMVVTDSQVFQEVAEIIPESVVLTSFSILFARHKGVLKQSLEGVKKIRKLEDKSTILIAEGCTHRRQCGDIATEKLPKWIQEMNPGRELYFEFCSGEEFPKDLTVYDLVLQCGGCMLNGREIKNRYRRAAEQKVLITNYGIAISELKGILERCIQCFQKDEN